MSRTIHKVYLEFRDDADAVSGAGLCLPYGIQNGFIPFWSGRGIFHDVLEHWFELNHKYFLRDAAFNVGGEIAAMGACMYYMDNGFRNEMSGFNHYADTICDTGSAEIVDALYGSSNFGHVLECAVPRQRVTDNSYLEEGIDKMLDRINAAYSDNRDCPEDEKLSRKEMFKSINRKKVSNLFRWGYHMAERKFPHTYSNASVLRRFEEYWDAFCKRYPAEELMGMYRGITFRFFKEDGEIRWTARFHENHMPDYEWEYVEFPRFGLISSKVYPMKYVTS
jgi:hypothetical protein